MRNNMWSQNSIAAKSERHYDVLSACADFGFMGTTSLISEQVPTYKRTRYKNDTDGFQINP